MYISVHINSSLQGLSTQAVPGTSTAVVTQTTPTTTISATLPTVDTLQLAPPTATPTADSPAVIIATADIQVPTSTNTSSLTYITLENVLLLVIVGSLVVSVVMLGACLMAVTLCACKRKSSSSQKGDYFIKHTPSHSSRKCLL